jgi:Tol biopolymer transport system component
MSLAPGSRLQGYEIRRQVGAGGMGVVYLAHDVKLGRSVAIKVLSGEFSGDPARTRRFEQEARAASALSHPNVCVVHALGETGDGHPFIAMEYIEGETLRHVLQTHPPTLKSALDIAIQTAAGVEAAHALGIVHRDLKPENVIVRTDGLVKVLDFGLAKLAAGGLPADLPEATRTLVKTDAGVVMGTFTYMSPEQARGKDVDARSDIWALGVVLYELVSGRTPFTGDTRSDVLAAILEREPPALDRLNPRVPHELQRIAGKALRKDRAQRYQTITDLRLDLESLRGELQSLSSEASAAYQAAPTTQLTPPPVRRESSAEFILTGLARHKVAAAIGLIAILAAAGLAWRLRRTPERPAAAAAAPAQRSLTRLTFGPGLQTDPTLSPDGRFLAYAADRAGNFDIWVQPVAGGDPVQVTKDPEPDTQPAWSADGSTIVYRSEKAGGGLFAVPALGGPSRRLTAFGEHPVWSRDGAQVLFLAGPSVNVGEGQLRAYSVAAEGGTPEALAAPVLEHGSWKWIAQHPDGRLSAMGTHEKLGSGFFTFSRAGEHLIKSNTASAPVLLSTNSYERFRFVWNRAGTRLYVETHLNVDNLWRVDVDPDTLEWRAAERLTTGGGSDIDAVLSADESRLAYVQQASSARLWSFPLDAAAGTLRGEGRPFSEDGATVGSLLPDGSAAVYDIVRAGTTQGSAWLHRFDGETDQLLASNVWQPMWAPDGRSVIYLKWQKDGQASMLVSRAPDGTERQLSPWTRDRMLLPAQAVPGTQSVLVSALSNGSTPLWLWNAERSGEAPQRVLLDRPRTNVWQPRVSPNGQWIAFLLETVGRPEPPRIRIARIGNTPITEWIDALPTLPNSDKPRWGPDGRTLYFLTNRGGFENLAAIRFDPDRGVTVGEPFDVTHFTSPALVVSPYMDRTEIGIAPTRAMLRMVSSTGSIWMLDNVDK